MENTPIDSKTVPSSTVPSISSDKEVADNELHLKQEFKKNSFDKEVKSLFKQSMETIVERYGKSMELGETRQEAICLTKYQTIYNNMHPEEHYMYFETLYNRNRNKILNTLKDDSWLRDGDIIIQFGEGTKTTKEIEQKRKLVRIMLSKIFLIACDLQEKAESRLQGLEGLDQNDFESVGGKDLLRPNIILLHLMRIFYYLNSGSDKSKLGEIVTHLETDLGITTKTVNNDTLNLVNKTLNNQTAPPSGGLSSLFTMATSMMEKIGYKPPPDMKAPSEADITNVIGSVFNNEATQNALHGMFASIQGCNDFGTAVQAVVKNVTDPKTMQAIQTSVAQTAQVALPGMNLSGVPGAATPSDVPSPFSNTTPLGPSSNLFGVPPQ